MAKPDTVYIQLGKLGDVLNAIPLCWLHYQETGRPCAMMVAREYAEVLEGCSYIVPELWTHDFTMVKEAENHAFRLGYKNVKVAQVYGRNIKTVKVTDSFAKEAWRAVDRLPRFGAPLVFDRRAKEREERLWRSLPGGRPVILVATAGVSSPFPYGRHLVADIQAEFGQTVHVVDLNRIRAERFHDLLGLYERAAALVAIDSAPLHLAHAVPSLPVVALVTHTPSLWHGTPARPNHILRVRYNEFMQSREAIRKALRQAVMPHAPVKKPAIIHVHSKGPEDPETAGRNAWAEETWRHEAALWGAWVDLPLTDADFARNGTVCGDKPLPFVNDMLAKAAERAQEPDDILLITNADINLLGGISKELAEKCAKHGGCYAHRWDLPVKAKQRPANKGQFSRLIWYPGSDLFAMTRAFWEKIRQDFPPMLLGREAWDWVLRELVKENGGTEIHQVIYHQTHAAPWKAHRALNPGNQWNRGFARKWLSLRGIPLKEIAKTPYREQVWPVPAIHAAGTAQATIHAAQATAPANSPLMDVLYVLGAGSKWGNNELRYSLRSLEMHAQNLGRIFIVGHNPQFLHDVHIHERRDFGVSKEHNIAEQLLWACEHTAIGEQFLWLNDDHFLLQPVDLAAVPHYNNGELQKKTWKVQNLGYKRSLQNAVNALKAAGMPTRNFEIHVPFPIRRKGWVGLKDWWEKSRVVPGGMVSRSIYGNVLGCEGPTVPDCKVAACTPDTIDGIVEGRPWFSIDDASINRGMGDWLGRRYPHPSKWEIPVKEQGG